MPHRDDPYDDEDEFEDDDRPRRRPAKPGLATAAGIVWAIEGVLCLLSVVLTVYYVVRHEMSDRSPLPDAYTPIGCVSAALSLAAAAIAGIAAFVALSGKAKSLTPFAIVSFVVPVVLVLARTLLGFITGVAMAEGNAQFRGMPVAMALSSFFFSGLQSAGFLLAGLFAMLAAKPYRQWKRHA
jgi:hypothetical protein